MRIYLLQDIKGHGKAGEVVELNDGYARNFVIKNKLGRQADSAVIAQMKAKADSHEFHKQVEITETKEIIKRLEAIHLTMTAKVGSNGKLFGSITATEITEGLSQQGVDIDRRQISLPEPIKQVGAYKILVKFPYGLLGKINLTVEV
jgi:large subunit ribosomal protein L9